MSSPNSMASNKRYFYYCQQCYHSKEADELHPLERMKCSCCGSKSIAIVGGYGNDPARIIAEKLSREFENAEIEFPSDGNDAA